MTQKKDIVIVDYDVGNIHSLKKAFLNFGQTAILSNNPKIIEKAGGVVLPGVGAFAAAMNGLKKHNLVDSLKRIAEENKPLLGICVGAQLFFTEGHEFGIHKGLDIVRGKVVKFSPSECREKIPQVGWNSVYPPAEKSWTGTIFEHLKPEDQLYFVHSFFFKPDNKSHILSMTNYGGFEFCSAVKKGNVYGCQFHPEKSGKVGLAIIQDFIKIVDSYK